jgi:hypothetical protein
MANEAWKVGETVHNGEKVEVWENEDGYFIEISQTTKYIDIGDYDVLWY